MTLVALLAILAVACAFAMYVVTDLHEQAREELLDDLWDDERDTA